MLVVLSLFSFPRLSRKLYEFFLSPSTAKASPGDGVGSSVLELCSYFQVVSSSLFFFFHQRGISCHFPVFSGVHQLAFARPAFLKENANSTGLFPSGSCAPNFVRSPMLPVDVAFSALLPGRGSHGAGAGFGFRFEFSTSSAF